MANFVIKRDGSVVPFQPEKIKDAIQKAMLAVNFKGSENEAARLTSEVSDKIDQYYKSTPSVEQIQDIVEITLIENNYPELAKSYILYRQQHKEIRQLSSLVKDIETVEDYIYKKDWAVKENANMDYSLQGLNNYVTSKIVSAYWLNRIYPEKLRMMHQSGDLHIHQLNVLGPYCVGWDLKDLLIRGFGGARGKVESKPARHFRTALMQIVNFFYTLQGESAGAQAFRDICG